MGPLQGFRIIEMAGIGPAPFCAMMLADMGADVIRIDRKGSSSLHPDNPVNRGRRSVAIDLKHPEGTATALRLIAQSDALIEGFRPGVMERLGLGPDICLEQRPALVYGRMTGWGQEGPLAHAAGHDINYIALSGALHAMGHGGKPPSPPLNLVGDYGGGGMLLATGMLAALLEASRSGKGQVVDAAMIDGSALLMTLFYGLKAAGAWSDNAGSNLLDGGAHFYKSYRCSDRRFITIGALEPQFYRELLERCGLDDPALREQMNAVTWPTLTKKMESLFATRTRDEWCEILEGTDACFAPVLDMNEAPQHAHNRIRHSFYSDGGMVQPAPAPRFSRSKAARPTSPPRSGEHTRSVLEASGFSAAELDSLQKQAVIA